MFGDNKIVFCWKIDEGIEILEEQGVYYLDLCGYMCDVWLLYFLCLFGKFSCKGFFILFI